MLIISPAVFIDSPTPSAQTGDNKEKNAIIGGVVGAVCFVGILAIVAVFLKKRHARRTTCEYTCIGVIMT